MVPWPNSITQCQQQQHSEDVWADTGVDTSCKTVFVMGLLAELVAKGHRTLIFSQSRVMLDILQAAITEQEYPFRRIDGSISSAAERQVSPESACHVGNICHISQGCKRWALDGAWTAQRRRKTAQHKHDFPVWYLCKVHS